MYVRTLEVEQCTAYTYIPSNIPTYVPTCVLVQMGSVFELDTASLFKGATLPLVYTHQPKPRSAVHWSAV